MIETAEFLADMPMGAFYVRCEAMDVNELDAVIRAFTLMQSDLLKVAGLMFTDMVSRIENKEPITFMEFEDYSKKTAGIGAVVKSLDEKIIIAKHFHYELTPDCFLSEEERAERAGMN
jgi:hypothetical protein